MHLRLLLSACARCKSLRPPIDIFCERCWQLLFEFRNSADDVLQPYEFPVYSLFTWRDQYDQFIRPLIYALKGGVIQEEVWMNLATELLFLRSRTDFDFEGTIVLPPRQKREDHAFFWGKALSDGTGIQINDSLENCGSYRVQKRLSLKDRLKKEFVLRADVDTSRTIIFVDDTITSGATARAAFEALGEPEQFEVWTIAAKPRYGTQ